MEPLNAPILFSVIAFILLLAILFGKAVTLKKANTLLSQQLTETSNSLEKIKKSLASLREKQQQDEFHHTLTDAALSTRIHTSRAIGANPDNPRTAPERYSYIHSLASRGLPPEEIASILSISAHEARQLVTLAKIAQEN